MMMLGRYIKDAIEEAYRQQKLKPSRENSIVITKLEEAYLWNNESEDKYLEDYRGGESSDN